MGALREMLEQVESHLKIGGVFVVLTYHSLEDKLVKNLMKSGSLDGKEAKNDFGQGLSPFRRVGPKFRVASEEEVVENNRARSAKLRVVEKIK